MKILVTLELEELLLEQIRSVSDDAEVLQFESREQALEVIPQVEVVSGKIDQDLFLQAQRLRWVQSNAAGAFGMRILAVDPEPVRTPVRDRSSLDRSGFARQPPQP